MISIPIDIVRYSKSICYVSYSAHCMGLYIQDPSNQFNTLIQSYTLIMHSGSINADRLGKQPKIERMTPKSD